MLNSNLLRKLDMQDLMVFVAVYEHNSVSGVSEALCVSQSTVSYCLKKLRTGFEKIDRVWSEVTSVLADTIPGIRVVKAFAQEDREAQRFRDANR